MALQNINPTTTNSWKKLIAHFDTIKTSHLKDFFKNDRHRAKNFTIGFDDFTLDFSKNRISFI